MGGSNGTPAIEAEQQQAPAQPQIPVANYQAFSPGQQGLLAQQMQAGYGGSLLDHQNAMGFYRDMQVPLLRSPGDVPNYMGNAGLPVAEGGTPANAAEYYQKTQPGYQPPVQSAVVNAEQSGTPESVVDYWQRYRDSNDYSGGSNR
tara:strand:- start:1777 stop:2214 length:438 start_codon:yes stop_codon:yes gene_type:complete